MTSGTLQSSAWKHRVSLLLHCLISSSWLHPTSNIFPPKTPFLHLFPPACPWISARLLKGERKPLEIIVLGGLGVQLILCVSTASLYSQQSTVPLGLNPLSVSAELVLTYSSGSDGGVGVVTHAWRYFQSQTRKRKFTEEPP